MEIYSMNMDRKTQHCQCQFLPTWSIDLIPSQSKSEQIYQQTNSKVYMSKGKEPRIANTYKGELKKWKMILSDLKTYYKARVMKTVWSWQRIDKQINETKNRPT